MILTTQKNSGFRMLYSYCFSVACMHGQDLHNGIDRYDGMSSSLIETIMLPRHMHAVHEMTYSWRARYKFLRIIKIFLLDGTGDRHHHARHRHHRGRVSLPNK